MILYKVCDTLLQTRHGACTSGHWRDDGRGNGVIVANIFPLDCLLY